MEKMQSKKIVFSKALNYGIKGLIVVVGILLLSGVIYSETADPAMQRLFGVVCILYGIYRIVIYRTKTKTYNFSNDDREEDDDEKKDA